MRCFARIFNFFSCIPNEDCGESHFHASSVAEKTGGGEDQGRRLTEIVADPVFTGTSTFTNFLTLIQEERGAYIGRVFALLSLVQSGRLTETVSNKPWCLLHHVIYLEVHLKGISYIVPKLLGNLLLRNAHV